MMARLGEQRVTNYTRDIPVSLDAITERLRRCDGVNYDCTVIVWEQCKLIVAALDRLQEGEAIPAVVASAIALAE
jgi:hypothetical protein